MEMFQHKLAQNPLRSRQDAVTLLLDLCRPLKPHYSEGKSFLHLGSTCAHYNERDARLEPGTHLLIHSVFGDLSHAPRVRLASAPCIETADVTVTVHTADGRHITICTED